MVALNLHRHDFTINDDGSVNLNIDYWGRIETAIGAGQSSVFQHAVEVREGGEITLTPRADIKSGLPKLGLFMTYVKRLHKQLNSDKDFKVAVKTIEGLAKDKVFKKIIADASGQKQYATAKDEDFSDFARIFNSPKLKERSNSIDNIME